MKFQVRLPNDDFDKLREIAEAERRPWRDQAAILLEKAIKAADRGEEVLHEQQHDD